MIYFNVEPLAPNSQTCLLATRSVKDLQLAPGILLAHNSQYISLQSSVILKRNITEYALDLLTYATCIRIFDEK